MKRCGYWEEKEKFEKYLKDNGFQELVFENDYRWIGKVIDGKIHGKGTMYFPDGTNREIEYDMGRDISGMAVSYNQHETIVSKLWKCEG
ncbi:MAG: hypothetical protein FWD49_04805 [Firmicutes bacterium]|nr:hypothetical protein [Bacillota bacterium]